MNTPEKEFVPILRGKVVVGDGSAPARDLNAVGASDSRALSVQPAKALDLEYDSSERSIPRLK